MRLVGPAIFYWESITHAHKGLCRKPIESWEEMKVKLKEIYFPEFYMDCLVDELHNLKSRHIVSSNYVGKSRILEDVSVLFENTSIVNDTSIGSYSFKDCICHQEYIN